MAIPKSVVFLLFIVTLCSTSVYVGQSQGGNGNQMACIQKLLPCQAFLKGTLPPSDVCCTPLKQVLASDEQCLCAVLTDPAVLKSFNVTAEVVPKLVKSCGGDADSSLCKSADSAADSAASTPAYKPSAATSTSGAASFLSLAAILSFVVFAFEGVSYVL